jgi:hypothetical protein
MNSPMFLGPLAFPTFETQQPAQPAEYFNPQHLMNSISPQSIETIQPPVDKETIKRLKNTESARRFRVRKLKEADGMLSF